MKAFIVFLALSTALGLAGLATCHGLFPDNMVQAVAGLALSFVPALATALWLSFSWKSDPEIRMLAGLGGSFVRIVVAVGGGVLLTGNYPETYGSPFWFWLAIFYLGFLAAEIGWILSLPSS